MISTRTVQVVAFVACGSLFVFMIFIAIWTPRAFSKSRVFSNHMRRSGGKRAVAWLIVATEIVVISGMIQIAQTGVWPDDNAPLAIPLIGSVLEMTGWGAMFWALYRLYQLQKSR